MPAPKKGLMMKLLEPQVLIVLLVIVLLVFGPKQLPELGKSLGKTMKSVREGMEEADEPSPAKAQASDTKSAHEDTNAS
jgi:sec-independent protein translocase protein TatA